MALGPIYRALDLLRRVDRLFQDFRRVEDAQDSLDDRLRALEARMAAFEADRERIIIEARAAAAVAAVGAVTQHLVDMSRRIGALEARADQDTRQLPKP